MYVVLNGLDGSGKDSQLNELRKVLTDAIFVSEPGGTKEGDLIRRTLLEKELSDSERIELIKEVIQTKNIEPYTFDCLVHAMNYIVSEGLSGKAEMFLYAAARSENVAKKLKPNKNETIISGRSIACSMSYQGKARGIGFESVWDINKPALDGVYPDLEIFLDLPIEVSRERLKKRTEKVERFDEESSQFFEMVREGYLEFYKNHCPYPVVIINADDTIENIHKEILNQISKIK